MNILVTGASGWLGRRFVEIAKGLINEEDRLILLTSKRIDSHICVLHMDYTFSRKDFYDVGVKTIDRVLHLGHHVQSRHKGESITDGNIKSIENTKHLLDNLPNVPEVFVYASSMAVYGANRCEQLTEKSILAADNPYGSAKIIIENLLLERGREEGFVVHNARLSHIYGPNDNRRYTIPVWLNAVLKNEPIKLYANPFMQRNCLYIDDCCRALLKILYNSDRNLTTVNLASRENISMLEIAKVCQRVSNNNLDIVIEDGHFENECGLAFDNQLCKELFLREEMDFEEGIENEFAYYRTLALKG